MKKPKKQWFQFSAEEAELAVHVADGNSLGCSTLATNRLLLMVVDRLDYIAVQHDAALAGISETVKVLEREVRKKLKKRSS